jgi:uroporphyrin-III C-methyltransferase / precorrin-2 dehydrogenase / sirohydrochlorin ferrochelatase
MDRSHRPPEATPPRMAALARLPVFLALDGKRAVIAGGSPAAAWKAELLSAAGARVDVYAGDVSDDMLLLAGNPPRGEIDVHRQAWTPDALTGAAIAIGAFDDGEGAAAFAAAARRAGVPVNVIDRPQLCDFVFGSIVNRSPLVIGISTDGAAPVFAQAIRARLEAMLPAGFAPWAAAAARWRAAVKTSGLSFAARRRFWQAFTGRALTNPDRAPGEDDFKSLMAEVKEIGVVVENGSVTLVGAGPGDPELLTLRALRALREADVILFDNLVSREILDYARREAKRLLVGKTGYGPSCRQEDINALMVNLAKSGQRVVRLKGGDPLIFGRAGEELAACKAAGVAVEVVPGITAAQGVACRLGIPLTDRKYARRLQYVTGHGKGGALPRDFDWHGLADSQTTTAIYMPVRTIKELVAKAVTEGLDPDMPAVAAVRATQPEQRVIAARIADLPDLLTETAPDGPVLVMIGRVCLEAQIASHERPRQSGLRA